MEAATSTACCVSPTSCSTQGQGMMRMMVNADYVACRQCASQCYASHHDNELTADDFTCNDKGMEEGAGSLPLLASIKNILLTKRRRPCTAPSFICIVSCNMLPGAVHCSCMSFPRSFVHHHLSKCVGEAKLEGPSGCLWHASLRMAGDSMVLLSPGWAAFAKDHGLQEGDGLIFTYLGQNHFKVRIFGPKEGYVEKGIDCVPSFAAILPCEANACKEIDIVKGQGDQVSPSDQKDYPSSLFCSSIEIVKNVPDSVNANIPSLSSHEDEQRDRTFNKLNDCSEAIDGLHQNNEHEKQDACFKIGSKVQLCSNNQQKEDPPLEMPLERAKALHVSFAANLCNPSVTKLLSMSAVHGDFKLVLPMPFVRSHMPCKNKWITLVDLSQKAWRCRWLGDAHTRERLYICGGWAPFVRAHSLKVNDVCIFELVDKQALIFNVYVFKF
ncbi:hypothetical protein L7F22_020441 [Adiantum nelumboides]|nr:hypothetical protein [Adiantum nelumboides]